MQRARVFPSIAFLHLNPPSTDFGQSDAATMSAPCCRTLSHYPSLISPPISRIRISNLPRTSLSLNQRFRIVDTLSRYSKNVSSPFLNFTFRLFSVRLPRKGTWILRFLFLCRLFCVLYALNLSFGPLLYLKFSFTFCLVPRKLTRKWIWKSMFVGGYCLVCISWHFLLGRAIILAKPK